MSKPKIRIDVYADERNTVKLWVDGKEIRVIELEFLASADSWKNLIRCHFWKHSKTDSGELLVLNGEIMTEKVIVFDGN